MIWETLNLEQLGTTSVVVAIVLYINYGLRSDLRAEREYSKAQEVRNQELNTLYQDMASKNIVSIVKLEAAFTMLREKVLP